MYICIMANHSLLRYAGGKSRAVNVLNDYIPRCTKEICSPFFGGGSFEISLAKRGITVHGYDNFAPLVHFWRALLSDSVRLRNIVMSYYPLTKDSFYRLQKSIHSMTDVIEIGAAFYVLNRSSFSGTGLSGGMSPNHPRFTESSIQRLIDFDTKFNIQQDSFEDSIPKHDCLIYADPPYLIEQSLYGTKGDMHRGFDHDLLSEVLNSRDNFILSYNNCDKIKDMYSQHTFFYPEWKYGMSKDKNSKEILIVSKDLA